MSIELTTQEIITKTTGSTAVDKLKVIRRNGTVIPFNRSKITIAMTKAFLDEEGGQAAVSSRVHELVEKLTETVCESLSRYLHVGGTVHIEDIQDQVELALMRLGEHKVARSYVLYREEHRKAREAKLASLNMHGDQSINITLLDCYMLDKFNQIRS